MQRARQIYSFNIGSGANLCTNIYACDNASRLLQYGGNWKRIFHQDRKCVSPFYLLSAFLKQKQGIKIGFHNKKPLYISKYFQVYIKVNPHPWCSILIPWIYTLSERSESQADFE
jgi:hypothetical protein